MAKIIDNKKGLKIIQMSKDELIPIGGYGICDFCGITPENGYYIAVLNQWVCKDCYEQWECRTIPCKKDGEIEQRRFIHIKKLLGL